MSWWCGKCEDWRDGAVCAKCGQNRDPEMQKAGWWCYRCGDWRTVAICPECGQKQGHPPTFSAQLTKELADEAELVSVGFKPPSYQGANAIRTPEPVDVPASEMTVRNEPRDSEREANAGGILREGADAISKFMSEIVLAIGKFVTFAGVFLYFAFWVSLAVLVFWAVWHFVLKF